MLDQRISKCHSSYARWFTITFKSRYLRALVLCDDYKIKQRKGTCDARANKGDNILPGPAAW